MDLMRLNIKLKEGFVDPQTYSHKMSLNYFKNKFASSECVNHKQFTSHAYDFALYGDRLLVSHCDLQICIYDASPSNIYHPKCLSTLSVANLVNCGLEVVNWNAGGEFFTFSSHNCHLYSISVEAMKVFDWLTFKNITKITHHRPSPHTSSTIAVASGTEKVMLADLRSGNVTSSSAYHPKGVISLSWCGINSNLLATAGMGGTCFWDIRKFRRPMLTNYDNCIVSSVLPSFEIIPNTDKLLLLNVDRDLTLWDVGTLSKVSHYGPFVMPFDLHIRYKFALAGLPEAVALFMPAESDVRVYDLASMSKIGVLSAHVMPVNILLYNNRTSQLFSSSLDSSISWISKR